MPLSVLLYEDDELLRSSLQSMISLNENFLCLGAYSDVLQATDQIQHLRPDLVFMDIDLPGMTGIEALKKVRASNQELPIIMLTVFDDSTHVLDAIFAGASGYLLKKHISTRLFNAVEEVLAGGAPMSPSIARMVIDSMRQKPVENNYQLSPREKEILTSLSQGNSYKMIASDFAISIDTVRTHIKRIYEKLQVHSQTEAVSKAINEGLV
ncbi:response regulator transcription factor [Imperialibacter roseus]|uniref:Response regulator transcription factor n=1 Tax=Imperialibacter roseus TaxID=1324217 RepID=A0ABZ0IYQ4_9BACT|nr:response regulator transcription factor [Imperialibacter roseus]WOK09519.1 response regulator transcription factor [Imperialibacter roseus]|tara:strand:- start:1196 stop:1825 length:630 start_codon:yes stop_codon:yes gene_type:complete